MRRAFLIFGPESSGTRMLTEYIIRCSGAFGDWQHYQALDRVENFNHLKPGSDIVWRRSLPHGGVWANIPEMIQVVESKGFTPVPIGIMRDRDEMLLSQRRNRHIKSIYQGKQNYTRAIVQIFNHCCPVIRYDLFIESRDYRNNLLKLLKINPPDVEPMEIRER